MKDTDVKEAFNLTMNLIEKNNIKHQICLSSFKPGYLTELKNSEKHNEIEYGFLIEIEGFDKLKPLNFENFPELDTEHKGTVNLHYSHCTKENIEFIRQNKLGVHVWFSKRAHHYVDDIITENEYAFKRLLELGVDVICTNYPDVALKCREEFLRNEKKNSEENESIKVC